MIEVLCTIPSIIEPNSLKCQYCDFIAQTPRSLQNHRMSHRWCKICGKEFSGKRSQEYFESHMKQHAKAVQCQNCQKTYKNKTAYQKHFKVENCNNAIT